MLDENWGGWTERDGRECGFYMFGVGDWFILFTFCVIPILRGCDGLLALFLVLINVSILYLHVRVFEREIRWNAQR